MTHSKIMQMPVGSEMNAAVLTEFFKGEIYSGNAGLSRFSPYERWQLTPAYSTGDAAACLVWREIIKRMDADYAFCVKVSRCLYSIRDHEWEKSLPPEDSGIKAPEYTDMYRWFWQNPDLMPLTVCRLALMLSEKESEEC